MRVLLLTCALLAPACVHFEENQCVDGLVCPEGTTCTVLDIYSPSAMASQPHTLCATPAQLEPCAGLADGAPCGDGQASTCHAGVCLPDSCGNGLIDSGEVCDFGDADALNGCASDCRSTLVCNNGIVDIATGEQCDTSDPRSHDGCASVCRSEQPAWTAVGHERPFAVTASLTAYDAARRRTLVFGGFTLKPPSSLDTRVSDTCEWDGVRWYGITTSVPPTARGFTAGAYDAQNKNVIMFGGQLSSGSNGNDTWAWDGTWTILHPDTVPPSRALHGMAYEAASHTTVMFGGFARDAANALIYLGDTWRWNGTNWESITTATAPSPRDAFAFAYDPKRDVVVLFGGYGPTGSGDGPLGDLWELQGTTWTQRTFTGGPGAINGASLAYDPVTETMLLASGATGESWAWDGTSWTARPVLPVSGTALLDITTDTDRKRVVLLGGEGDVHEWDGSAWSTPAPDLGIAASTPPSARAGPAVALDPVRHTIVLFGGNDATSGISQADTWIWNGVWTNPTQSGTPPTTRFGAAMAFDIERDEMILFSGNSAGLQDTYTWKANTWTKLTPTTLPGQRQYAAIAYDAARKQVVMFGGQASSALIYSDTWLWTGSDWVEVAKGAATHPPVLRFATMAYDPIRKNIVLFGGDNGTYAQNKTWIWDGATWTDVSPVLSPPARGSTGLAWDAMRQRMVLTGGYGLTGPFDDVWEWNGATWNEIGVPSAITREGHALVSAPDGAGVFLLGGLDRRISNTQLRDIERLRWNSDERADTCMQGLDVDGDGKTGCEDPDCWWTCTPTCPPGAGC